MAKVARCVSDRSSYIADLPQYGEQGGVAACTINEELHELVWIHRKEAISYRRNDARLVLPLASEVRERDGHGVLAELSLSSDRTRALIRDAVCTNPESNHVRRASGLLRAHLAAQLAMNDFDFDYASTRMARLATFERQISSHRGEGIAMQYARDVPTSSH